MSPSADPQALPGVAVHGMIPATERVKNLSLKRENDAVRRFLSERNSGGSHTVGHMEVKS